jgi:hypothetical protein
MQATTNPARAVLALLLPLAMLAAGCERPAELVEVEGVVIDKAGKPVPYLRVVFYPDYTAGTVGPESSGATGTDGKFRLKVGDKQIGAVPGKHRVCIVDLTSIESTSHSRIPQEYASVSTTPLKGMDVQPGQASLTLQVPVTERKGPLLPPIPPGLPPDEVKELIKAAKKAEAEREKK